MCVHVFQAIITYKHNTKIRKRKSGERVRVSVRKTRRKKKQQKGIRSANEKKEVISKKVDKKIELNVIACVVCVNVL